MLPWSDGSINDGSQPTNIPFRYINDTDCPRNLVNTSWTFCITSKLEFCSLLVTPHSCISEVKYDVCMYV